MIQVSEGIFRGDMDVFVYNDYKSILNLETDFIDLIFNSANREFTSCFVTGVHYYDMAFSGYLPPSVDDLRIAASVIAKADKPIYVHCRHGRERTGIVIAAYRILYEKWPFEKAYQEWIDMGCHWPFYLLWKKALRNI